MTVSVNTSRADYLGNGVTVTFSVPFYFVDTTHIRVLLTVISSGVTSTLALGTDYSVTGVGVSSGGAVTLTTAPASGTKVAILRNVPYTQLTKYEENDPFPAASHEQALDLLTMEIQQLAEQAGRVLTFPASDSNAVGSLPTQASRANRYLAFDAVGNPTVSGALPTEIYYGAYASAPSTRPDGTAIQNGDMYFNTTENLLRVYSDGWTLLTSTASFPFQIFSGNGSTTSFTLSSQPGSLGSIEVYISGVRSVNGVGFTWNGGTTLTFSSAPASGSGNIFVRWVTTQSVGVPSDATVTTAKIVDANVTTAKLANNAVTLAKFAGGGNELGRRNLLINGSFAVNQGAVSGTVTLSAGSYGHDMWKAGSSGCTYSFSTSSGVTTITITSGTLQQIIEDKNIPGGMNTLVMSWSGTAQGKIGNGSFSSSGVTASVNGGSNLTVEFNTGTLSKVQLERGSVATPFEHLDFSKELFNCQRYFETGTVCGVSYGASSTAIQRSMITFRNTKRATPTMAFTYSSGTSQTPSAVNTQLDVVWVGWPSFTGAGQETIATYTANARL